MTYQTLISTEILAKYINNPNWIIFDCRFSLKNPNTGLEAYQKSHLPNAHYVHLDNDLSSKITDQTGRHPLPDFNELANKLGHWGIDQNTQVVVYDDAGGAFAGRLWWLLRCLGHHQVALLDGGFNQWLKEQRELTATLPKLEDKNFHASLNTSFWLSTEQIETALKTQSIQLLDARTPERFRGEQEPIDSIAGHIPGALNRAFQSNLNADGKFLSATILRQQFTQVLGDQKSEKIVHMCGSGVTACHNFLAMEIAGLHGSRLYPGSWSEWIRDKNRPIVKQ